MRKRGLCCRPVSVRPSVTLVYSIHTAEDIVKLLSPPGSPITLVFLTPGADTQFQGEPLQWGRKRHGVGKICDFRLKSPFISETVRDRPMVAVERLKEVICALSNDDFFNDLHGPLSRFSRSRHFYVKYLQNFF